jgi:hypothetical protein
MQWFIPRSTDGQRMASRRVVRRPRVRNPLQPLPLFTRQRLEVHMLRGGLLWLIGIPLPIILLLFFFGFLH